MKKFLALILALAMTLSMSFAAAEDFDVEAYGATSSELYTQALGEFYDVTSSTMTFIPRFIAAF